MCCCPCDVLTFTGSLVLGLHASAYLPRAVCALVGFLAHMFACCAGEHVSIACVCSCGAQVALLCACMFCGPCAVLAVVGAVMLSLESFSRIARQAGPDNSEHAMDIDPSRDDPARALDASAKEAV